MAYICRRSERSEIQLDLDKCVDRGVPSGPLWRQLINGEDVTLPNGEIVRVEDVKETSSVFIGEIKID